MNEATHSLTAFAYVQSIEYFPHMQPQKCSIFPNQNSTIQTHWIESAANQRHHRRHRSFWHFAIDKQTETRRETITIALVPSNRFEAESRFYSGFKYKPICDRWLEIWNLSQAYFIVR